MKKKVSTKKITEKPKKKEIKKKPKTTLNPARKITTKKVKSKRKEKTKKVIKKVIAKLKEKPKKVAKKVITKIEKKVKVRTRVKKTPLTATKKVEPKKINKKPKKVVTKVKEKPEKIVKKVKIKAKLKVKIKERPKKVVAKIEGKAKQKAKEAEIKKTVKILEKKVPAKVEAEKKEVYHAIEEKIPPTPWEILPQEYGGNSITLITVDPNKLFTFWEVREDILTIFTGTLNIRVYDVTGVDFDGINTNSYFDIAVNERIGSCYIDVRPAKEFIADIGIIYFEGIFITVARSNKVSTPPIPVSEEGMLPQKLYETGLRIGY
jgi:hypothetical protein